MDVEEKQIFKDLTKPFRDFAKAIEELKIKRPELFDKDGYLKEPKDES